MPPRDTPSWFHVLVHVGLIAAPAPLVVVLWFAIRWRQWDAEWRLDLAFVVLLLATAGMLYLGRTLARALWTGWPARFGVGAVALVVATGLFVAVPSKTHPSPNKRVAVVGAGAAGMHAAWMLERMGADVTVFEAAPQVGGHALTFEYEDTAGTVLPVDVGFIFGAPAAYEELKALLAWYGVPRVPVTLDLSGHVGERRWATGGPGLDDEVARFQALADAQVDDTSLNLLPFGRWLDRNGFDRSFRDSYLTPLLTVLFITDTGLYEVSTRFVLNMMAGKRRWLSFEEGGHAWAVGGGSGAYYSQLAAEMQDDIRLLTPVSAVERKRDGVHVTAHGPSGLVEEVFDDVVLAVPANVARRLLMDRTWFEDSVLGQVRYDGQEVVLHTDPRALPRDEYLRSYNVVAYGRELEMTSVASMQMGGARVPLQPEVYVTLNPQQEYDGVLFRRTWKHYSMDMWHLAVTHELLPLVQGAGGVHYAGDWVSFIGHGPAIRTGMKAACRVGGTTPRPGLSTTPCVPVTLIDPLPSEGLEEQATEVCGELGLFELLVDLACPEMVPGGTERKLVGLEDG